MNESERKVVQKFRERTTQESLPEGLRVVCRVTGGMPSEHIEEEFTLYASNKAHVKKREILGTAIPQEGSSELQPNETRELLQQIAEGLDCLVTRSDAHFLPDSSVGTITIEVDGEELTLYFLADEEERLMQNKPITPQMDQAVRQISTLSQGLLLNDEVNNE